MEDNELMFLAVILSSPSALRCHSTVTIGPRGSVDMKAIHLLYSFVVYLLVLVVDNIIINDMIAYRELYMMCTSYLSTILEGMWKSTKITGKPVPRMRFESRSSAIQSRNTALFTTAFNITRIPAVHPIIPVHLWL